MTLVLALAACSEPADPSLRAFSGTFALQAIDGQPLPIVQYTYGQMQLRLLGDTVISDGRGRYGERIWNEVDSIGTAYRQRQLSTATGTYSVVADTVFFAFNCPPGALCIEPPVRLLTPNGDLLFEWPWLTPVRVAQFAPVR